MATGDGAKHLHRLQVDIFPSIGGLHIATITAADLLHAVRLIERRGAPEVARRVAADVARIFVYAQHCGRIDRNPAANITKVLKQRIKGHFAAIESSQLPEFLKGWRAMKDAWARSCVLG